MTHTESTADRLAKIVLERAARPQGWLAAVPLEVLVELSLREDRPMRMVGVDHYAEIVVRHGRIEHACFAAMVGVDAVLAWLDLEHDQGPARLRVRLDDELPERTVALGWAQILERSSRRQAARPTAAKRVGPRDETLRLGRALADDEETVRIHV